MGRVKLMIKKLENTNGRQTTYAKRKHGIMKKANELSILCDIDIVLLMFSPSGKPLLCSGKRSTIEEVITKFAQITPQERAKRKLESLEALKKTFRKLDHDVNIRDFLGTSSPTVEELSSQARLLQSRLSDVHNRLSFWTEPEKINSLEHLGQLENSLRESLDKIRAHKENFGKQQLMSQDSTSQIENAMPFPFGLGPEHQLQPLPWLSNDDARNATLREDPNYFPHRDVECSASSSFGSYSGYFGTGKSPDIANSGPETSLLDELNGNATLKLQANGQYPYIPYSLNLQNDFKFQPFSGFNVQMNPSDYHINGMPEIPTLAYDATGTTWPSSSMPCSVSAFDDPFFPQMQQPN